MSAVCQTGLIAGSKRNSDAVCVGLPVSSDHTSTGGRAGIDKLDLQLPGSVHLSDSFQALWPSLFKGPGREYQLRADLRNFGIPALLHWHHRYDPRRHHKLELVNVGEMSAADIQAVLDRVIQEPNPLGLRVMRLDAYVDVENLPVFWFFTHATARHKRKFSVIGRKGEDAQFRLQWSSLRLTLHLGSSPDSLRVYDKASELRAKSGGCSKEHGDYQRDLMLTRVERQFGGGSVPDAVGTLGKLLANAQQLDPFEVLRFQPSGVPEPDPAKYSVEFFLKGMAFRQLILERGLSYVRAWLNRSRNAKATLVRYADFIPADPDHFEPPRLTEMYRAGVIAQLRGENWWYRDVVKRRNG